MPCESCAVQFSVFKRKRACSECERYYCSACLRRGGGAMCAPCRVLSTRPLARQTIAHLKVRDLQCFLQRQNISTRGCVEKEELVSLCVSHVNSAAYRRRGSRSGASPFSSLKGLTNNINVLINSAFDLRSSAQPAPPPPQQSDRPYTSSCYNSTHAHGSPTHGVPTSPPRPQPERFTTRPGGEPDIDVHVCPPGAVTRSASGESARVDSADCFEIEDLDDAGWELVNRPADPLPNDSEVLLSTSEGLTRRDRDSLDGSSVERVEVPDEQVPERTERGSDRLGERLGERLGDRLGELRSEQRASSELQLRTDDTDERHDSTSLQDEPLSHHEHDTDITGIEDSGGSVTLEQVTSAAQLERLSVRQLKELLARNRVPYAGCLERADLLLRARTLWRNYATYKDEVDKLPLEECCKICMAAPLECVLLECGHIAGCTRCSRQLAECPICRQYVVRAVRFFRS